MNTKSSHCGDFFALGDFWGEECAGNTRKCCIFACINAHTIMHDQIREDIFFFMFYASVAMLSFIACCYLLFRRANAVAPDVTPPVRLRRWTAAFFAAIALCHLWYLSTYFLTSLDDVMLSSLIAGLLDSMTVIPLTIVVLLVMLQDRRRPLWFVAVMVVPLIAGNVWGIATRSDALLPVLFVYFLLM